MKFFSHTFLCFLLSLSNAASGNTKTCQNLWDTLSWDRSFEDTFKLMNRISQESHFPYFQKLDWLSRLTFLPVVMRSSSNVEGRVRSFESAVRIDARIRHSFDPIFEVPQNQDPIRWAHRQVLEAGLLGLIDSRASSFNKLEISDRTRMRVRRILSSKAMQRTIQAAKIVLLMQLPQIEDKPLSLNLFEKVIVDGPFAHQREIELNYFKKGQQHVDQYRIFRRLVQIIAFAIVAYLIEENYEKIEMQVQQSIEQWTTERFILKTVEFLWKTQFRIK